jgi:hypothetical protein
MVCRGRGGGATFTISLQRRSLAVSVGGHVVAYDRGGRLYSVFRRGHTYRRGLNGRVLEKWQDRDARCRRSLQRADADGIVDGASSLLAQLSAAMRSGIWEWLQPPEPGVAEELPAAIGLAGRFDADAARLDAERFNSVYRPVGILPPDQYLALVLQATEGCSFGSCTFCNLYHDPYRVRTPAEFVRHIAEVRSYMGGSLALRGRSVFLGSANALAVPMPRLLPLVELASREFPAAAHRISAFVDAFTGVRKGVGEYRELAAAGLRQVYIGLESGHDPLRGFVHKPGTSADAIETVRTIKSAGLNVGIIVMIGLGGDRFAACHVDDTLAALRSMDLGQGDLLYFSDLVELPGTAYSVRAADVSIRALTGAERAVQRHAIRDGLAFSGPPPRIATYDVREFIY